MTAARFIADGNAFFDQYEAGTFTIRRDGQGVATAMVYCCPCGCGVHGKLRIGVGHKPVEQPSWEWNGSTYKPTLKPSVNHVDHWHGFLTDGVWIKS